MVVVYLGVAAGTLPADTISIVPVAQLNINCTRFVIKGRVLNTKVPRLFNKGDGQQKVVNFDMIDSYEFGGSEKGESLKCT